MRQFEHAVEERYFDTLTDMDETRVFQNPTLDELVALASRRSRQARGLVVGGDIYVWSGDGPTHKIVEEKLGFTSDCGFYFLKSPSGYSVTVAELSTRIPKSKALHILLTHPKIKRFIPQGLSIAA